VGSAVAGQFTVPGAWLYTETRGAGPLLLLVVGGNGDPGVFSGVADRLAGDFTVVSYARRGFARSPVDGPVDDAGRIAADAGDAAALIAGYGGGPARVFGSSSGAIVTLELVTRHPGLVRTAVVPAPRPLLGMDRRRSATSGVTDLAGRRNPAHRPSSLIIEAERSRA